MSLEFTILCTRPPTSFLEQRHAQLRWDADTDSGTFEGLRLDQRPLRPTDPLPEPGWASRVVSVIHASGHLSEDGFEDFDIWSYKLAQAVQGAIYNQMMGIFTHAWSDSAEKLTSDG